MYFNPHAKCRSSKFNLKLFKKRKNGGHLSSGNTLVIPEGTLVNNEYPDEMSQNAAFYLVNAKATFRG